MLGTLFTGRDPRKSQQTPAKASEVRTAFIKINVIRGPEGNELCDSFITLINPAHVVSVTPTTWTNEATENRGQPPHKGIILTMSEDVPGIGREVKMGGDVDYWLMRVAESQY